VLGWGPIDLALPIWEALAKSLGMHLKVIESWTRLRDERPLTWPARPTCAAPRSRPRASS
jgi:hypothetical protein